MSQPATICFTSIQQVRFAHCDAAGIIFYPRAFELLNAAIEDWFDQGLGYAFASMHGAHHRGIPTVDLHASFVRPLLLGEAARFDIRVLQAGTSSLKLDITASVGDEIRMRFQPVLVHMNLETKKSDPWPDQVADQLAAIHNTSGVAA